MAASRDDRPTTPACWPRPKAMAARFAEPSARRSHETARLAEELEFELTKELGYRYPGCRGPRRPMRKLAGICEARLRAALPAGPPASDLARGRLEEELRVIDGPRPEGFFLLHHDLLELAREVAHRGARRSADGGSPRSCSPRAAGVAPSVSSIVCYLTGLSHIDPIAGEPLRSGASSTRTSRACRTSTSTSRARSASG